MMVVGMGWGACARVGVAGDCTAVAGRQAPQRGRSCACCTTRSRTRPPPPARTSTHLVCKRVSGRPPCARLWFEAATLSPTHTHPYPHPPARPRAPPPRLHVDGSFWVGQRGRREHLRERAGHASLHVQSAGLDEPLTHRGGNSLHMWRRHGAAPGRRGQAWNQRATVQPPPPPYVSLNMARPSPPPPPRLAAARSAHIST